MNQSILQGEPLAPGLSELLGLPQLSNLNVLELTKEERYDLLWLYLTITMSLFFGAVAVADHSAVLQHVDHAADQPVAANRVG